jgi:hypothetical protein
MRMELLLYTGVHQGDKQAGYEMRKELWVVQWMDVEEIRWEKKNKHSKQPNM